MHVSFRIQWNIGTNVREKNPGRCSRWFLHWKLTTVSRCNNWQCVNSLQGGHEKLASRLVLEIKIHKAQFTHVVFRVHDLKCM